MGCCPSIPKQPPRSGQRSAATAGAPPKRQEQDGRGEQHWTAYIAQADSSVEARSLHGELSALSTREFKFDADNLQVRPRLRRTARLLSLPVPPLTHATASRRALDSRQDPAALRQQLGQALARAVSGSRETAYIWMEAAALRDLLQWVDARGSTAGMPAAKANALVAPEMLPPPDSSLLAPPKDGAPDSRASTRWDYGTWGDDDDAAQAAASAAARAPAPVAEPIATLPQRVSTRWDEGTWDEDDASIPKPSTAAAPAAARVSAGPTAATSPKQRSSGPAAESPKVSSPRLSSRKEARKDASVDA